MNWIALSAETEDVVRDAAGVPVEWTLLRIGSNPICQEGQDGAICLNAEAMNQIVEYHAKKGELIPVDSEHYLFELASRKHLDEAEALKMFPGGVAALGYGALSLSGENLRIRVQWTPAAHEMLKEKIYCIHELPLSLVCDFFVSWRKREGVDGDKIKRPLRADIMEKISARIEEMSDEFLNSENFV